MLKVLLVDDESVILKGLSMIIDWEEEGFTIVGHANNGKEALERIIEEQPDVVISDIRMPEMTGLELLERVRSEKISDAGFIILTGFDDFNYARSALKNDALDYLLKPVEKHELLGALAKAKKLREEKEKQDLADVNRQKEIFSRNLISIIKGKADMESVAMVREHIGELTGARYISIELDETDEAVKEADDEEKRSMQKEMYACCKNLTGEEFRCIFDVSLRGSYYDVGIIYSDELLHGKMTEREYIGELKSGLEEALNFPIIMNPGSRVDGIENLAESCKTVMVLNYIRTFEITSYPNGEDTGWNGQEFSVDKGSLDELVHSIEINSKEDIQKGAALIYEQLTHSESRVSDMAINYLLFELIHVARELNPDINQEEVFKNIGNTSFDASYLEGNLENITLMLMNYADYINELRGGNSSGILKTIEADMRENYKDNLTLKDFGKKYYVNSAYLGQLFKSKYGMSFKAFLHKVRIEKAEELLMNTDMKMYSIAEAVGYKDTDYFINHFIAEKGCTPTKYRKQSGK